jgi:hypothetical protein
MKYKYYDYSCCVILHVFVAYSFFSLSKQMYKLLFYPLVGRVAQGENGIFWTIIHARHNRANQPIVCTWITSTEYKDSNIRK